MPSYATILHSHRPLISSAGRPASGATSSRRMSLTFRHRQSALLKVIGNESSGIYSHCFTDVEQFHRVKASLTSLVL
jgi:hypothetical protein